MITLKNIEDTLKSRDTREQCEVDSITSALTQDDLDAMTNADLYALRARILKVQQASLPSPSEGT